MRKVWVATKQITRNRYLRVLLSFGIALVFLPKSIRYFLPGFIFLTDVTIIITTKCTLRCKDCVAMIPNYKRPHDFDMGACLSNIRKIVNAVDGINALVVQGGETFLYPQLSGFIAEVVNEKKIDDISVIINGTLLPDDKLLLTLKNKKITVLLSDYGPLSNKKDELIRLFEENGICYEIRPMIEGGWIDYGLPEKRNRTKKELQKMFKKCSFPKQNKMIIGNNLYSCCRIASMLDSCSIPVGSGDCFSLETDRADFRKDLIRFWVQDQAYAGCDYCDFVLGKKIEAAVQITNAKEKKNG